MYPDDMGGHDIEYDEVNNQVVELGFEDAQIADGFAMNLNQQLDKRPHNMYQFMKSSQEENQNRRFGHEHLKNNDELKIDLFRIQKKIDVKKLKF